MLFVDLVVHIYWSQALKFIITPIGSLHLLPIGFKLNTTIGLLNYFGFGLFSLLRLFDGMVFKSFEIQVGEDEVLFLHPIYMGQWIIDWRHNFYEKTLALGCTKIYKDGGSGNERISANNKLSLWKEGKEDKTNNLFSGRWENRK